MQPENRTRTRPDWEKLIKLQRPVSTPHGKIRVRIALQIRKKIFSGKLFIGLKEPRLYSKQKSHLQNSIGDCKKCQGTTLVVPFQSKRAGRPGGRPALVGRPIAGWFIAAAW
jgi:hypothetical protein